MSLPRFDTKRTAEVDAFAFDFINALQSGESLTGGGTWAVSVSPESTVADAGPSLAVDGTPNIVDTTKCAARLKDGLSGVLYVVTCTVGTSNARTLQAAALVLVLNEDT